MNKTLRPLSRRQLEMFVQCPRCFWMLRKHGIDPPKGYPLALNTAMDKLLKEEFDAYRAEGKPHPILAEHGVDAKPFADFDLLQEWRNNRQGIRWADPITGCTLFGAVDDILEMSDGALSVLDYKSSGAAQIKVYESYRLQLDTYMFLLEQNGYKVAPQAYLAFFVAVKDDGFRGRLPFKGTVVAVPSETARVGELFREALILAEADEAPPPGEGCEPCR